MKVWLVNPHDAVPGEPWGYKHGMFLARTLAERGHQVTYWASNFSHATKQFRSQGWGEMQEGENIRILMVPVRKYEKHASITRLLSLADYARNLLRRGKQEERPDCIIATNPIPFGDYACVKLKQYHKTYLITDLRDLWPDIFVIVFPKWMHSLARLGMAPLYALRKYAFQNSDAVTAVCESYMQYANSFAPKTKKMPHRVVYSTGVEMERFHQMMSAPAEAGDLEKRDGEVWVTYAGTLGRAYDVEALMESTRIAAADPRGKNVRFVIAGDGPLRGVVEDFISKHRPTNVTYLGPLDMPRLCRLYAKSDVGLSIYARGTTVALPAKAFDYYAAEIPIVNSVNGEFEAFLKAKNLGVNYVAGDPQSLAESILKLASDAATRSAMKQCLKAVAPQFDRDRQYAQFAELLPRP